MKRALFGFSVVSLFAMFSTVACSSNGNPASGSGGSSGSGGNSSTGGSNGSGGNSSSGGSNGSGGDTSSSGGSSATGGSSSGSGGSSASGGSSSSGGSSASGGSTGNGGSTACATASGALIADFATATGGQVGKPYASADTGLKAPAPTVADGALTIDIDTGTASTDYPWAFAALAFNGCADGSAYQGVAFNISGTLSEGCTIQFSAVDKQHNLVKDGGTCTVASCYPSSKIFTLPAAATDITVNFADQTGGGADTGALVVDPKQLMAVQWQINVPKAGSCKGSLKIDNITFK